MTHDRDAQLFDLTERIRPLAQVDPTPDATGPGADHAVPVNGAPAVRVPMPRRWRVFLRRGEGHGTFADLTVTAPRPRPAAD